MKGLGFDRAKEEEVTGLDVFSDLLNRLNGKSEAAVAQDQRARLEMKTNRYVEQKYGAMRFVKGGLLVGDVQLGHCDQDLSVASDATRDGAGLEATREPKKTKKSKKRRATDAEQDTEEAPSSQGEDAEPPKKKRKNKKEKSEKNRREVKVEEEMGGAASSKSGRREKQRDKETQLPERSSANTGADAVGAPVGFHDVVEDDGASGPDKRRRSDVGVDDETSEEEEETKKKKRKKKEKNKTTRDKQDAKDEKRGRRKTEGDRARPEQDRPAQTETAPAVASGASTPAAGSASGTSTPQSSRNYARSRFIAQKKQALLDAKALNQVGQLDSAATRNLANRSHRRFL